MIHATIIGNLGAPAEWRTSASGGGFLKMSVACNSKHKENNEWVESVDWVSVVWFGPRAEALAKLNLDKGTRLAVRGGLRMRSYEKTDGGGTGYSLDMVADEIELLGGKRPEGDAPAANNGAKPAGKKPDYKPAQRR